VEPQNHHRERVVEALREELAEIVAFELSDPRVEGVEVVEVHADPALKHVQVQVISHGNDVEQAVEALEHAKGFLKSQLTLRLDLRRVPELHFSSTANLGPPERVQSLLKRIRRGRPRG
jgi:ribosome-binding factor A